MTGEYLLFIAISTIMPMVVALVTRRETLGKYKAYILLALASLNSLLLQVQADWPIDWSWNLVGNLVIGAVVSFITAVGLHTGLLKPQGVTGKDGTIAAKTENIHLPKV